MTKARLLYVSALLFALVFVMTLYDAVTLTVLVIVLLLPLISLALLAVSYLFVKYEVVASGRVFEKKEISDVKIVISNDSIIPIAWMNVYCSQLDSSGRKTTQNGWGFPLMGLKQVVFEDSVCFNRRGQYTVGIKQIEIYDILGLYSIKINVERYTDILVVPKKILTESLPNTTLSDTGEEKRLSRIGEDRSIISHIKDYQAGDSYKSIHWKLSSKSDELLTKVFQKPSDNNILIIVDLQSFHEVDSDIGEDSGDAIVEAALSIALRCVYDGKVCEVMWYDAVKKKVVWHEIDSLPEYEMLFEQLAVSPVSYDGITLEQLYHDEHIDNLENTILYYVAGSVDLKNADMLSTFGSLDQLETNFICFDLLASQQIEDYCTQLNSTGVITWRFTHTNVERAINSLTERYGDTQ